MTPLIDSTGTPVAMVMLSADDLAITALALRGYVPQQPTLLRQRNRLIYQLDAAGDGLDTRTGENS